MESQIVSTSGNPTPFAMNPFVVEGKQLETLRGQIEAAKSAKQDEFTDISPIYWEASAGQQIVGVFLGWKQVNEKDAKTGEVVGQTYKAVFHDGDRQIVAGQIALIEAMYGKPMNVTYRITCTESAKGKAKKFKVEQFNA